MCVEGCTAVGGQGAKVGALWVVGCEEFATDLEEEGEGDAST